MSDQTDVIKSVSQLSKSKYTFYVPAYQRGYRWSSVEVKDLLRDINAFHPKDIPGSSRKSWYCLQPLVVRKRPDLDNDDTYEIIDGQQRITTIFLIGRYINERWRGPEKDPTFSLKYEARKDTGSFLDQLKIGNDGQVNVNDSTIDYFHISEAYQTISNWMDLMKSRDDFNQDAFTSTFLHHVKVIWYEPPDGADSISIFTRINMGKIPLTNAELVKALFLNQRNFASENIVQADQRIRLRQMEISGEWDRMEAALHNPEFWYFLDNNKSKPETRIDLVLGLLKKNTQKSDHEDMNAIFRDFAEQFERTDSDVEELWIKIKRCFQTLEEWFLDRELYHKIGYLVCTGISLGNLYELVENNTKTYFLSLIDDKIKKTIPSDLDDLNYSKRQDVFRVLLLHNIKTMLNGKESQARFPFDRFKLEDWDVEHIHAVTEKMPTTETHQKEWLDEVEKHCSNNNLAGRVKALLSKTSWDGDDFKILFEDLIQWFSDNDENNVNDLSNLVLLDQRTNRGYGNAIFPEKRQKIIEREKQGVFVPVCTKNVFMKFYSADVKKYTVWCQTDREAYADNIKEVVME